MHEAESVRRHQPGRSGSRSAAYRLRAGAEIRQLRDLPDRSRWVPTETRMLNDADVAGSVAESYPISLPCTQPRSSGRDVRLVGARHGIAISGAGLLGRPTAAESLRPCRPTSTGCAIGDPGGRAHFDVATRAIVPAWSATSRRIPYIGWFFAYGESRGTDRRECGAECALARSCPIEFGASGTSGRPADVVAGGRPTGVHDGARRRGEAHGKVRVAIAVPTGRSDKGGRPGRSAQDRSAHGRRRAAIYSKAGPAGS